MVACKASAQWQTEHTCVYLCALGALGFSVAGSRALGADGVWVFSRRTTSEGPFSVLASLFNNGLVDLPLSTHVPFVPSLCQAHSASVECRAEEAALTPDPRSGISWEQGEPATHFWELSPARHRLVLRPHLWEGWGEGRRPSSTLAPFRCPPHLQTASLFFCDRPVSPIMEGAVSMHRNLAGVWLLCQGTSA